MYFRLQLKHMVMLVQMLLHCVLRLLFNRYSCPDYSLTFSDKLETLTCLVIVSSDSGKNGFD